MIAEQLSLDDALARREAAMRWVSHHAPANYREKLIHAIEQLAGSGRTFYSDDIRLLAGDPPEDCSPNLIGALVNHASRAGLIEFAGYTRSARVVGHGNTVKSWRGRS